MRYLVAADTGGTFTDVAVYDAQTRRVSYGKTLTRYADLVEGVLDGLGDTGVRLEEARLLKHGTTHVINTLLQRNGSRTALVTTRGFRDLIEIARGNRPVPFMLGYRRDPPLVPRTLRFELDERMAADGSPTMAPDDAQVDALARQLEAAGVEAVAVSFLNAYANPAHEERVAARLAARLPAVYVTASTALTREWYEYERTSTAVANAYVGGRMRDYIRGFDERLRERGFKGSFYMMGSNGGVLSVQRTLEQPVALVESGPIGGCIGAAAYAKALGLDKVIAFDMGGTTAKCALIQDGRFDVQPIYYVGGYERGFPLKTAVLDIVEVGAGGGSIAAVDAQGRLTVGPRSAGSEPGPVAYGRGGTEPTVTDANLVLGRISDGAFLSGRLRLDRDASAAAIAARVAAPLGYEGADGIDIAAQGILDLGAAAMAGAIKEITIERGLDVRDFALMVFGGGGPLFGSTLARQLRIPTVIVPPHPGNFSTLGMLIAGARIDLARTLVTDLQPASLAMVDAEFAALETSARATMAAELQAATVDFDRWLEARYRGQTHTVRVAYLPGQDAATFRATFDDTYRRRYGHVNPDCEIEVLGLRLGAAAGVPCPELAELVAPPAGALPEPVGVRSVFFPGHGRLDTPLWRRERLPAGFVVDGPAVIEEFSSTTIVQPDDHACVGVLGEIRVERRTTEQT